jgi:predicted DNA-binding WGR domain protein
LKPFDIGMNQRSEQLHESCGRFGANGQTQTNSFTSESTAAEHTEKQIASKLAKGYRELAAV